jgi:hypothetical protein
MAAPAGAAPLTWSAPRNVDPYAPAWANRAPIECLTKTFCLGVDSLGRVVLGVDNGAGLGQLVWLPVAVGDDQFTGVACPSMSLCVGIDLEGDVVTSTIPTGDAQNWTTTTIAPGHQMQTIACPSTSLCIATDDAGEVFTSTNPAGGAGAWSDLGSVGHNVRLLDMSCPSASLCVGVGSSGEVVTSTNPTGGSSAWKPADVDGTTDIEGISCPTTSLCVAVDAAGHVLTSSDLTTDTWSIGLVDASHQLNGISCPSEQLCVAVDGNGSVLVSINPASGAGSWSTPAQADPSASLRSVFCLSAAFCIAGDDAGRVVTATDPIGGPPSWYVTPALTVGNSLNAMSCPSDGLCVAVDAAGRILTSTDPAAAQPSWDAPPAALDPFGLDAALSCASSSLCIAIDNFVPSPVIRPTPVFQATIMSSTHPADGASAWTAPNSSQFFGVGGISCPSSQLCVLTSGRGIFTSKPLHGWKLRYQTPQAPSTGLAESLGAISCSATDLCAATTDNGNVVSSTDPTGGRHKWKAVHIDNATSLNAPFSQAALEDISCASGMLCAAVDNGGNVFTSIDPTGGKRTWTRHNLNLGYSLTHIACPSISLCVALGSGGNVVWSTDRFSTWAVTQIDPGHVLTSLSCPSATLCVVGDDHGNIVVGTGLVPAGVLRRAALAALTQVLRRSCTGQSARRIARRGGCPTAFGTPGLGQVTITWLGPGGRPLAAGQLTTIARGKRLVHVVLTAAGRRFLRHHHRGATIRARATFVDAAGHRYETAGKIKLSP